MKMIMTPELPKEEGYYWWTNFGEHTPCVLEVKRSGKQLYADGGEFGFAITKPKVDKDPDMKVDGHFYGEELWCRIPNPIIDGKEKEPDCY